MYYRFYGLKEKPFSLSADPRFLYLSRSHNEALAQMTYAAAEDAGFLILTGEVGTGKTLMINALTDRLPEEYRVAKICHTALNPDGLIQNICKEFDLDFAYMSTSHLILKIQDFLKHTHYAGEHSILILDEAQNLSAEILEEIRLLSNFEAEHKEILQIFLVGQPELEEKLASKELRQLRERINLKYRLGTLDRNETSQYIARRLTVAGYQNGQSIFTKEAIDAIYKLSNGIPRRINILCENALLEGYAGNSELIYEKIIRKVGAIHTVGNSTGEVIEKRTPVKEKDGAVKTMPPPVAVKQKKRVTTPPGNNGGIDYNVFQTYLSQFLEDNNIYLKKKSKTGPVLLKVSLGFILLVFSFVTAIYVTMQLGILDSEFSRMIKEFVSALYSSS